MRTQEEIRAIQELAQEIHRRGIVLTDSRTEWLGIAYSLAEGGEQMRPTFHLLASMSSKYKQQENDQVFTHALRKVSANPSAREMSHFLSKCWDAKLQFPPVLMSASQHSHSDVAAASRHTSSGIAQPAATPLGIARPTTSSRIDASYVQSCRSDASGFVQSVIATGLLTAEQARRAAQRYRLGAMRDGSVIYWQIDDECQVRDGKVMQYGPDCHRLKSSNPNWMSWLMRYKLRDAQGHLLLPIGWQAERCLFGLHLLPLARPDQTICVVEAEKTAVICSERVDADCLWLASGGMSALNAALLRPLGGHRIKLYPDTDPNGQTYRQWCDIAKRARHDYQLDIEVSDLLEHHATPEQKEAKIDLVDWIACPSPATTGDDNAPAASLTSSDATAAATSGADMVPAPSPVLQEMIADNPDIEGLIQTFALVESPLPVSI